MEIKKRNVFITGANRGIGRAFAVECAKDQAHLFLVVRQMKGHEEFVQELESQGAKSVQLIEADLSCSVAVKELCEMAQDLQVDILFNNAGMLTGGLFEDQEWQDIQQMFQVNQIALMQLTQALLPGMLKRKRGKIINNSSVAAIMQFPCASTYAASKAAVLAFTNSLKQELRGTGVSTLLLITPGIKTRMYDQISELYGSHIEFEPSSQISTTQYARMIREAVIEDLEDLKPAQLTATGLGLTVAHYLPKIFQLGVRQKFSRKK